MSTSIVRRALIDAIGKLDPRHMVRNPVMFVVEIGSAITTALWLQSAAAGDSGPAAFTGAVSAWLWLTVLFAAFSEALAEGRGRARADALRATRELTPAQRITGGAVDEKACPHLRYETVTSTDLRSGNMVLVNAGDHIPADGEVTVGVAMVDESAITGESAPVLREAGGDRSAVTGGTRVISDWLVVRVTVEPGGGFLDRMIQLVEGSARQKTPNELALSILLSGFSLLFLVVCVTLYAFSVHAASQAADGRPLQLVVAIALLVCLVPTTIAGLLPAIGIAGMERLVSRNVIATSGRAVEAAGDVDVLMLDKTGTITLGNRRAVSFVPVGAVDEADLARAAQLSSLADETPEGRSIVELAKDRYGLRGSRVGRAQDDDGVRDAMRFVAFSAETRMSGVDYNGTSIRKGAPDAMYRHIEEAGASPSSELRRVVDGISRQGGTPLIVARNGEALGVIHLKDVVKGGMSERFAQLRRMGIETVMVTGDNPLTAAAIAAEAGVSDFLAEATPEAKLQLIKRRQAEGRLVAMTGDGTNDAPALAQADVAVAMNTGTQPAREAANMIDLDSNPTKLIEIVAIGKQLLMTRGALTTFSLANDVSKYFAVIPAAFAATYPQLQALNVLRLATPGSAILSAVVFNALIIVALVPLALRGVPYRAVPAAQLLRENMLIYGLGGLLAPFAGIKLIDMLIALAGWA